MSTFRTFRAPDARSALAMVKAALGSEAVILSTREVSNGLFKPKEMEVTAALADPSPLARAPSAAAYVVPATPPAPVAVARPAEPPKPVFEPLGDELSRLRTAMDEVRREMKQISGQVRLERELKLPTSGTRLLARLIDRGVEETLAESLVREGLETARSDNPVALQAAVREALAERVVGGRPPWMSEPRRRTIALVGPTGVGKTTTLAKIAARAIMESKLKVALVTVDTYRIGASEQVQRYGEIMAVPTFVARDRLELAQAMEKTKGADLVLVDTAGRSVSEAVAKQAEMLRTIDGLQLYLVLSACTGAREMAAAADRYRTLEPERLIITKADEAQGPGSLVSASTRLGRPIVAVTDGQRVPEDIHSPSTESLLDLVLGDNVDRDLKVGGQ